MKPEKYVERFDIHTMEGYILRHKIEQWLEEHFSIVDTACNKYLSGEPIFIDCLLDDVKELLYIIMFMRDVGILTTRVYVRYKSILNQIIKKLEDEDNECCK